MAVKHIILFWFWKLHVYQKQVFCKWWKIYLFYFCFIYWCLHLNRLYSTASCDRKINERAPRRMFNKMRSSRSLSYYAGIFLEILKETEEVLSV
jgi:hypothetical protein